MRLRKHISNWSIKTFLKIFGFLFLFFNVFYVLAGYVDHKAFFNNQEFLFNWLLMGLAYPIFLSLIATTGFRSSTLIIGDFQSNAEFREKLIAVAIKGYAVIKDSPEETILTSTFWFFKAFNAWRGSENITIRWGPPEITIHGSQRKISSVEDALNWSPQFKS